MRNFIKIACLGAIALTSLASCNREPVNPNYNPVDNTVNADFIFNVSTGMTPQTRQNAANTQADISQAFRGITNAQLFAYKLGTTEDGKHVATASSADKTYSLGNLLSAESIDPDGSPKSRRVIEISLPVETNALMFWGKAPQSGTDANKTQGHIAFDASNANITNHSFSLQNTVTTEQIAEIREYEDVLLAALNNLSSTRYQVAAGGLEWPVASGGTGETNAAAIDVYWSDFVTIDSSTGVMVKKTNSPIAPSNPLSPLGEILAETYITFHYIWPDEIRAGSGQAVFYMFSDLYTVFVNMISTTVPSNYQEFVALQIANELKENLEVMVSSSNTLNTISQIKTLLGLTKPKATQELDKFPTGIYDIPTGGIQLLNTFNATAGAHPMHTWSYNMDAMGPGRTFPITKVMYPAELCYFGNSPIRVSDDPHTTAQYPDGSGVNTGEWMNPSSWGTEWSGMNGHVQSTTRSVAMAHNINYGTALLETSVKFPAGVTTIYDNNKKIQQERNGATEENKSITVSNSLFELVGILVGGQNPTMGWNYITKDGSSSAWDHVIYDHAIVSPTIPTANPTYTMVWDNYDATQPDNAQNKVYVALELKNISGDSFWGEKNIIRNQGIFYLIGQLDPTDPGLTAITWPTNYALPPYNTDGSTKQATRVFIQDFKTTANFVIGPTSLQHAYVTVPDLRSSQISLGLSVDLAWSTGLVFDDIVLGGN